MCYSILFKKKINIGKKKMLLDYVLENQRRRKENQVSERMVMQKH